MFSFSTVKIFHYLAIVSIALLLDGCAGALQQATTDQANNNEMSAKSAVVAQKTTAIPKRTPPKRPNIELTEDILFKILVAEIAGQRGKIDIAVKNYLALAKTTRDPAVAERATHVAIYARNNEAAYTAARLWLELDPDSFDAHQILTVIALRKGDIDQALRHLDVILKGSNKQLDQKLWMIANFLGREEDKAAVMQLMERLMEDYMDNADAMYAFANVSARMGDLERAKDLLKHVLEIKPDNETAALTYIALLRNSGNINTALEWLEASLKNNDVFNLRMAYARLLTEVKRFDDARIQFEKLSKKEPDNVDILYALGLLYLQINKLEEAEKYFVQLTILKKRVFDANYYLGRIAEEKDELDKASDLYQGVHRGENYFDARIRLSLILAKQGEIEKALTNIRSMQKTTTGLKHLILMQAEGEILTEQKRYQEAMAVLNKAIEQETHPDLLYSRAMLAEKMDRLDILEADLKAIIAEDANNATALNALGYTLADRTDRYGEAYDYIKRAYELSPEDFYILDSLGWVLYRMGRFNEAVDYLQQALKLRNDPEVAAHLGEVFWVMGNKQAAREVWETALKGTPTDDRLLKVIERFKP